MTLVQDIISGEDLSEPIQMTSGDIQWASDNLHVLYTVKDELDRPYKVLVHAIGSAEPDAVVYEESDEASAFSMHQQQSEVLHSDVTRFS